ncbi:LPS export ABC transporter permease LptF [Gilvimarinus polysaccharolyticus]|uniref:LPS export ABC transporter permease LptF n=1 Tax=Gilvimarinus polysaccharolyticus TaxID=863921 RepID=UPI000673B4B2|nr:LPS export ABC transporter permease LptF [Gilvimarinus polysaccharolyticus]
MIVFRYLSREVLVTTLAVSTTLLLIIMSGRFVKYLGDAASGKIAVDLLFTIMAYRLPGFLELIVPLGFFIAILLAYGRLHMDSEMVVLSACGMSQKKLLLITAVPALMVALIVGAMSLWVSPWGAAKTQKLFAEQRSRSEFTTLRSGHFQPFNGGKVVAYVESISDNRTQLNQLFLTQIGTPTSVAIAEVGKQRYNSEFGERYLELHNGIRYQGRPGSANYQITEFDQLAQHIPEPEVSAAYDIEADARPTRDLLKDESLSARATLQWRLSMPLLVLVVAFMSVPLSHTNPRQGRYLKMLPAIILYLVYLAALSSVRSEMEAGKFPILPGLWSVHAVFIAIAWLIFVGPSNLINRLGSKRVKA